MDKFIIEGGIPLQGKVKINGAKNAALPLMAACLLTRGKCTLKNIPHITDVDVMSRILEELGAEVRRRDRILEIDSTYLSRQEVPGNLMRAIRGSILVLGPLLARLRQARIFFPGGCPVGRRPIDLHLKGLKQMGAKIEIRDGYIKADAEEGLKGDNIYLNLPSMGATENIMLAASLAKGRTVIENAHRAPEVADLANFLKKMGAKIEGERTDSIKIEGVKDLHPTGYSIIPDRIETGTLIIAAIITRGKIRLQGAHPHHLDTFFSKLREVGIEADFVDEEIRIGGEKTLKPLKIETLPYPGFSTDLQPQMTTLACLTQGTSIITETIWEQRFNHIPELRRMGAQIEEKGSSLRIRGVPFLQGAVVKASDIQGGAALVLAGLAARGTTQISRIYHIDRGYERLEEKLSKLGAKMVRIKD